MWREEAAHAQSQKRPRQPEHRKLGATDRRLVRCRGKAWTGFGVHPKGNWKSQKAWKLKGEV